MRSSRCGSNLIGLMALEEPASKSASTSILDFSAPQTVRNQILLSALANLWYSVLANTRYLFQQGLYEY